MAMECRAGPSRLNIPDGMVAHLGGRNPPIEQMCCVWRTCTNSAPFTAVSGNGEVFRFPGVSDVPTSVKKLHRSLSAAESERAIFVDFEGFQDQPPSLIGMLVDGSLTQVVLDPRLTAAASAKGCRVAALRDVALALKRWCQQGNRKLVGYSQHELRVFSDYADVDFRDEYRDARMIAKRWWNICRPGVPRPDHSLKTFLAAIGKPCPSYFGERKMTSRLRSVIGMLSTRRTYAALTPVVKAKWRKVLSYNEYDCRGMQALVAIASREIATTRE